MGLFIPSAQHCWNGIVIYTIFFIYIFIICIINIYDILIYNIYFIYIMLYIFYILQYIIYKNTMYIFFIFHITILKLHRVDGSRVGAFFFTVPVCVHHILIVSRTLLHNASSLVSIFSNS